MSKCPIKLSRTGVLALLDYYQFKDIIVFDKEITPDSNNMYNPVEVLNYLELEKCLELN